MGIDAPGGGEIAEGAQDFDVKQAGDEGLIIAAGEILADDFRQRTLCEQLDDQRGIGNNHREPRSSRMISAALWLVRTGFLFQP